MTGPVRRLLTASAVKSEAVLRKRTAIVTSVALRFAWPRQARQNASRPTLST